MVDAVAMSSARRWAVNEVGAAIAQQLVEPLTALMVYVQEIKRLNTGRTGAAPNPMQEVIDGAQRETERVCAIMERIGNRSDSTAGSEFATGGGNSAPTWWSPSDAADGSAETVADAAPAGHHGLTPREQEVLNLVSGGVTNKEGALLLKISPRTFEAHRAQIMRKLGARNVADLLRKVLVEPRPG
ncbi:helix-turn-helix transcriptional regulator [Rhodopseudomonas sp. P2A-2r]|uniref:response regulator transcription factor n=1 Tax=Rhodopseudomonas sp. P2A-2r TaxID=2991972 RepID=UPI002233F9C9|nr:helix-turn-helix transcriptional regulator [Rhodopseudomonas sp. P2A-2r]UZE49320.1 helix-turn-helix transcriptional regulator [Rhodopseudomonas sp. P2A-2r]